MSPYMDTQDAPVPDTQSGIIPESQGIFEYTVTTASGNI